MSKHRWKDLKKSLWIHINPEKGEELKAVQIEDDDRRGKILKLIKTINQGKKEAISKKKSELLKLFDDIQQQYQFLYALYDNLTSEVRKVVDNKDEDSSESSDSEPFYSPNEFSARNSPMVRRFPINSKLKNDKDQGTEEAYLKDKLTSTSEVVKEAIDATQELGKTTVSPETMDESSLLKVKLFKSKEKIQSMTNVYDVYKMETAARIKELEGQVFMLKLELDTMETEKTKLEEQLQTLQENNSQIENQNFDFEKHSVGETEKSLEASDLQSEVNSLASQTVVLKRSSSKAECFQTLIDDRDSDMQVKDSEAKKQLFEQQIRTMINDANESREAKEKFHEKIVELEKRSREREYELSTQLKTSETRRNSMSEEIVSLTSQLNSLQQEVKCLQVEKSDLFLQIDKAEEESEKLSTLRNQNSRLTEEVEDQQKTLIERQVIIDKYNEEHKHYAGKDINVKSYVQQVEKKIEEAAEGLRKQLEDNLRILSRRIRVAEQLHLENKDLYSTTKEKYEQDSKDLETLLHMLKDFSLSANSMLNVLDTAVLRFEELNDHFMNRISQVTGALIFAKDWMNRKNNTITHMKDDLDTVLKQLDDKESEILGLREKVRKLENKVRKADKLLKQKEEGMLSLGEEKREAIRQLCVWMDYHRSHSEHLKKMIRSLRTP